MNPNFRPQLLALAAVAAGVTTLLLTPGCSTKPPAVATGTGTRSENPWPKADSQLRKDGSLASCRGVLAQLNSDLALNTDPQFQPEGLSPEAEAGLRKAVTLTDEEVKELLPTSFSNLDPHYLAECLYLRDAAQSLGAAGLPAGKQAELAFAWVCRQLVLNPWLTPVSASEVRPMPPVPPTYTLRRGSGSGLERAYVFLALLQQLGIDGCLVGPPEAEGRGWAYSTDPKKPPKGPFWAVGARDGGEVHVFDPWRGEPLPGTLAQVKAKPDLLKAWVEDKVWPWDVAPEQVKAATPFLIVPLTGLAPRMRRLEKELQATGAPRLAIDPNALRTRFATGTKLPDVKFWNPAGDPFTPTRVVGSFLPPAEGGTGKDERLYGLYQQSAVPADLLNLYRADQVPPEYLARLVPERLLKAFAPLLPQGPNDIGIPEVIKRVATVAISAFTQAFLVGPTPRERIQRGQFAEVTPSLVESKKRFDNAKQRVRSVGNWDQEIKVWCEKARAVFTELAVARAGGNPAAIANAEAGVELFWRKEQGVAGTLVDLLVAETGLAEATFLLAVSMNEQAERAQTRYERLAADTRQQAAAAESKKKAADDWDEAKGSWDRYQPFAAAQNDVFPGRAEHAKRLAERAALQLTRLKGR